MYKRKGEHKVSDRTRANKRPKVYPLPDEWYGAPDYVDGGSISYDVIDDVRFTDVVDGPIEIGDSPVKPPARTGHCGCTITTNELLTRLPCAIPCKMNTWEPEDIYNEPTLSKVIVDAINSFFRRLYKDAPQVFSADGISLIQKYRGYAGGLELYNLIREIAICHKEDKNLSAGWFYMSTVYGHCGIVNHIYLCNIAARLLNGLRMCSIGNPHATAFYYKAIKKVNAWSSLEIHTNLKLLSECAALSSSTSAFKVDYIQQIHRLVMVGIQPQGSCCVKCNRFNKLFSVFG
jgi:hypothetical protein